MFTKKSTVYYKILFISIVILTVLFYVPHNLAYAADTVYSDVLSDLQKDENFKKEDYPINQTDYSLKLIQIAESITGELLAYVYQPSAGAKGIMTKKIRISYPDSETYNDYDLTLLSRNGVFFKYKVDGYVTDYNSLTERVYNVIQIMRPAVADLGDKVLDENNNTISYVPYPVNWTFKAKKDKDGNLCYGKTKSNSSVVDEKYCGQLLFDNPANKLTQYIYGVNYGMLHFIAFNAHGVINEDGNEVQIPIEKLQKADVSYTLVHHEKDYRIEFGKEDSANYDKDVSSERISKTLNADKDGEFQAGILANKYKWKEIMTMDAFISDCVENDTTFFSSSLTEAARTEFSHMQYVLILCVTEITHTDTPLGSSGSLLGTTGHHEKDSRYYVNDQTILRLEFETDGKLYNLGVVDNYQTGDGVSDNKENYGVNEDWWSNRWAELEEWIKIIVSIIGIVLIGIVLIIVLPPLWKFIKFIFKIIFAPFRLLFRSPARSSNKTTYRKRR